MIMNEELQNKYMQLQMLEQQTSQMQQHIEQMDQQAAELVQVAENLREIQDVKEGTAILVPMAGGVFVRAKIDEPEHVLINVGASSTVQKPIHAAVSLVENQLNELVEYREKTAEQLMAAVTKAHQAHTELKAMAEKA